MFLKTFQTYKLKLKTYNSVICIIKEKQSIYKKYIYNIFLCNGFLFTLCLISVYCKSIVKKGCVKLNNLIEHKVLLSVFDRVGITK